MKKYKRTLPNGYGVELLQNTTEELIYEIWEEHCYTTHYTIQKDDIVLDIGANQGIFSLYAAYHGATVHAFEPNEQNYEILCNNITANDLENRIYSYYGAVTSKDGIVSLMVPAQGVGVNPSTFGTTSGKWIESLSSHNVKQVSDFAVKAFSMKTILKNLINKNIAIMKVDVEGAEMDILDGVDAECMITVHRIAMEIHGAYDEVKMYKKINDLNFTVISYTKLHGSFKTGYLYAENNAICHDNRYTKPVAVLGIPEKIIADQYSTLNAGKSFSTRNIEKNELVYQWSIDGDSFPPTKNPIHSVVFKQKGVHSVSLSIWDDEGDTFKESAYDTVDQTIWVFSEDSAGADGAMPLEDTTQAYRFDLSSNHEFYVPEKSLPKDWLFKSVVVCVNVLATYDEPEIPCLHLIVNGDTIPVQKRYQELYFPGFPNNHDFVFSLHTTIPVTVTLQWYTTENVAPPPEIYLEEKQGKPYTLEASSHHHVCTIDTTASFIICKSLFPRTWGIKAINVCAGLSSGGPTEDGPDIEFVFNQKHQLFNKGYLKIALPEDEIDGDVQFRLNVNGKNTFIIVWWPT